MAQILPPIRRKGAIFVMQKEPGQNWRACWVPKLSRRAPIPDPECAKRVLRESRATRESESFCVMLLDKRHRLIELVELFRGTIDGASVHELPLCCRGRSSATSCVDASTQVQARKIDRRLTEGVCA